MANEGGREGSLFDPLYEDLIKLSIEMKSDQLLENENEVHCRTLIKALLEKVKIDKYVGIFTGNMHRASYDPTEIIQAFKKNLESGIKVKIIFQTKPAADFLDGAFYKEILSNEKLAKNVDMRVLHEKFSEFDKHHITVNDAAFRFETDHLKKKAVAGFFNKEWGGKVRKLFEDLSADIYSHPIPVASLEA